MKPKEHVVAFKMQHQINNFYVDSNGCWVHRNKPNEDGYIRLKYASSHCYMAHRLSYALYREPIYNNLSVLHSCDNPPCINPSHLFLGTQEDNMKDSGKKGRGRPRGTPQLSEDELGILKILRERGLTQKQVAEILGVTQGGISYHERKL